MFVTVLRAILSCPKVESRTEDSHAPWLGGRRVLCYDARVLR
jgi:hypothetical protein